MSDDGPAGSGADGDPPPKFPRDSVEFNRIVNLTDAVAAIALTLLVLTLDVPEPSGSASTADMATVFGELWPSIFALLLSFVIIATSWYKHHRFIARLRGLDGPMVAWSFLWLLALVLVPFASDLIGTYGSNPGGVAAYAAIMGSLYVIGLAGEGLARREGLLAEVVAPAQRRARLYAEVVPAVCFFGSIPATLATQSTAVGYWTWVAIWPVSTVAERHRARVDAAAAT